MAVQFDNGLLSVMSVGSAVLAGATLDFYASGTSSRLDTFSDSALSVPNSNSVVADASGRFGPIWLQAASYKYILKTAAGVTLVTRDPIDGSNSAASASFIQSGVGAQVRTVQDRLRDSLNLKDFYVATDATMQPAFDKVTTEARASGRAVYVPGTSTAYTLTDKVDWTNVRIHGDGECSVITGAPGKDILSWKRPDEAGYSSFSGHYIKGLRLNLDCTVDASANFMRVGAYGERVGNCAIVLPNDNAWANGSTPSDCILEDLNIYNPLGSGAQLNRSCGIFSTQLFNRMKMSKVQMHFPDYGYISGIAGAKACTFTASTDTVNSTAHGFTNGTRVCFFRDPYEALLPGEASPYDYSTGGNIISNDRFYYVINAASNSFQVSLTSGGSAIDFTTDGSGTCYVAKASTSCNVEYAPDEWYWEMVSISCWRNGITACNNNHFVGSEIVVHPYRAAARFCNYPSLIRASGGGLFIPDLYTEGPLAAVSGEYVHLGWRQMEVRGVSVLPASGQTARVNISRISRESYIDVAGVGVGALVVNHGNSNLLAIGGTDTDVGKVVNYDAASRVLNYKRTGPGVTSKAATIRDARTLTADYRGGFDPAGLALHSSQPPLGDDSRFVPAQQTYLFAHPEPEFSFVDAAPMPAPYPAGLMRIPSALSGSAVFMASWNGRTGSTLAEGALEVGKFVPQGRGVLLLAMSAGQACTCNISVNLVSGPAKTISLTTTPTIYSFEYDATATALGTGISVVLGPLSVSTNRDVHWFYFMPYPERLGAGIYADVGVVEASLADGGTTAIANGQSGVHHTGGAIAAHTFTLPPDPRHGDIVRLSATAAITTVTVNPNTGQTIENAPTTLAAGGCAAMRYSGGTFNKWRRRQ